MKKKSLLQTSTLWINFLLVFFITLQPLKSSADRISGFYLDEGFNTSSFKYKSTHNLIILPVVIEGRKLNLIFDTGMNSILIFDKNSSSLQ